MITILFSNPPPVEETNEINGAVMKRCKDSKSNEIHKIGETLKNPRDAI